MRPLIFLDVDGPLIPFGGPAPHPTFAPNPAPDAHPLLGRVDPAHGLRLAALGGELVWATTWTSEANEVLAPRLGLPPLPVVDWPDGDEDEDETEAGGGLHWKTRPLAAWAAGRPYVWLDDEITPTDRTWTHTHHPAPTLLHRVASHTGLTEADFTAVREWLARHG
ncbi:HAD domain-containing protein [Streptomyces sp. NPDC051909]|uniref:HAD domain-containing protein n=1 Tax=Streptomyces sp. NPDC051909 TaxID=3154944 RepID=UPI00343F7B44